MGLCSQDLDTQRPQGRLSGIELSTYRRCRGMLNLNLPITIHIFSYQLLRLCRQPLSLAKLSPPYLNVSAAAGSIIMCCTICYCIKASVVAGGRKTPTMAAAAAVEGLDRGNFGGRHGL